MTDFSSTNNTMMEVYPLRENYDDLVKEMIYDKRRVEIFNITGTVFLNAISEGYIKRYLRGNAGYFGS